MTHDQNAEYERVGPCCVCGATGAQHQPMPNPVDTKAEQIDSSQAHPEWPAKEGVEVGCDDRSCSTCYEQTESDK